MFLHEADNWFMATRIPWSSEAIYENSRLDYIDDVLLQRVVAQELLGRDVSYADS